MFLQGRIQDFFKGPVFADETQWSRANEVNPNWPALGGVMPALQTSNPLGIV